MLPTTGSLETTRQLSAARRLAALSFLAVLAGLNVGCGEPADDSSENRANTAAPQAAEPDTQPQTASDANPDATPVANTPAAAPDADSAEQPAKSSAPAAEQKTAPPATAATTGSFSGRVVLDGEPPELPVLARADDENLKDKEVCGMADVPDDSLLIGQDKGIANVFLYLRRAPKGFKQEPPTEPVVLDQKGCVFTPHTALIQTGQPVMVKSSDGVQHNVHTFPARNQGVNILIKPNDQDGVPLEYARAESEPIQVKCDIHAWMASYHLVLDHPFMAVTDDAGSFRIEGLPVGDYEFRVWHERAGLLEREFAVSVTGSDEPVQLTYSVDTFTK